MILTLTPRLTQEQEVPGSIPGPATYFRFSFRWFKNFWRNCVHGVPVNRLGGLSLSRETVGRLIDRPDMTIDVYRGRKTTTQQHIPHPRQRSTKRQSNKHTLKQCP